MRFDLPEYPQRVGGEGAASRAKLGVNRIIAARAVPAIGEAGADHFAEHLVDFRRSSEVAARPERVAGGVIMRVAGGHIGLDTDRPGAANALLKVVAETQAMLSVPAIGSTLTRRLAAVAMR